MNKKIIILPILIIVTVGAIYLLIGDPRLADELEELKSRSYPLIVRNWQNFQQENADELDISYYFNESWSSFLENCWNCQNAFEMGKLDKFEVFFDKDAEIIWVHIPFPFEQSNQWIVIYYKVSE